MVAMIADVAEKAKAELNSVSVSSSLSIARNSGCCMADAKYECPTSAPILVKLTSPPYSLMMR